MSIGIVGERQHHHVACPVNPRPGVSVRMLLPVGAEHFHHDRIRVLAGAQATLQTRPEHRYVVAAHEARRVGAPFAIKIESKITKRRHPLQQTSPPLDLQLSLTGYCAGRMPRIGRGHGRQGCSRRHRHGYPEILALMEATWARTNGLRNPHGRHPLRVARSCCLSCPRGYQRRMDVLASTHRIRISRPGRTPRTRPRRTQTIS